MTRSVLLLAVLMACDDHLFQAQTSGLTPDWCSVEPVIADSCATAGCHAAASLAGGLDLETDPRAALVEVASTTDPGLLLVQPGDPDASFFLQKVEGTQADDAGARMPPGTPLTEDVLAAIRTWIADGAADCEVAP